MAFKKLNFKKMNQRDMIQKSKDFLVVARIESLILGKGLNDALKRAKKYCQAGADAILIHSKDKNPKKIFQFAKMFRKINSLTYLVAVPSSYSKTYEKELIRNGFNLVIYANHILRASYLSMNKIAEEILKNGRSYNSEKKIAKINQLLEYSS